MGLTAFERKANSGQSKDHPPTGGQGPPEGHEVTYYHLKLNPGPVYITKAEKLGKLQL